MLIPRSAAASRSMLLKPVERWAISFVPPAARVCRTSAPRSALTLELTIS